MLVGIAGDDAVGDPGPGIPLAGVEVAQLETGDEQAAERAVEVCLLDVAASDGFGQVLVFRAALHIGACQHSLGRGFGTVLGDVVPAGQEIAYGTAVAGDDAIEAPLLAQYLLLVAGLGAAGLSVDALVGAHHLGHLALLDEGLEGGQIGLPEVALREVLHIELMTVPLRAAMHGEVLGAGEELFVAGVSRVFWVFRVIRVFGFFRVIRGFRTGKPLAAIRHALQPPHHGEAHPGCQVGVFAVGLLSASPAWVAEDVDVGCPEGEALVALDVAGAFGLTGLYAGLVADGSEDAVEKGIVKRSRHAHCDGEYGGEAVAADPVESLVPPLELGNAQAGDSG